MSDLGTLGGTESNGFGINDSGQVTGSAQLPGNVASHAFLYSGGAMTDLGSLGGDSDGWGINAFGQVSGTSLTAAGLTHAFLYSGGKMTDLGTLGGNFSAGRGINDFGQITGFAELRDGSLHAFLYTRNRMKDLGTLGGNFSEGLGVNNAGQVVGSSQTATGGGDAFLYTSGQRMVALNTLLPSGSVMGIRTGLRHQRCGTDHGLWHQSRRPAACLSAVAATSRDAGQPGAEFPTSRRHYKKA